MLNMHFFLFFTVLSSLDLTFILQKITLLTLGFPAASHGKGLDTNGT